MEQTAMQQHIEWLKAALDISEEQAPTLQNIINLCLKDAESKLELEKNKICDAWENGYQHGACVNEEPSIYHGNQYYNKNFKSEQGENKN